MQEQNLTSLTTTVKSNLQRWNYLPLSLASRIQIIKMNVLPRYLYVFQCLPIFLPKSFCYSPDNNACAAATEDHRVCLIQRHAM